MRFLTPVYHPNIDEQGRVCLDSLTLPPKGMWSPLLTLEAMLLSVQQLMAHPNGSDGLSKEVTDVYNSNRAEWERRARQMTQQHAVPRRQSESADGQSTGNRADEVATGETSEEQARETSDGKRRREEGVETAATEANGVDEARDKRAKLV